MQFGLTPKHIDTFFFDVLKALGMANPEYGFKKHD